jgi:PIN domain nuclease of toxin-antitoxin system
MREQADAVFVSHASLWEMAIRLSIGKLRIDLPRFAKQIEATGFEWLDIRNAHLLAVATLPLFEDHRDPFDRLLVAQSSTEPLILLTADAKLERYGATVRVLAR